MNNPKIEIKEVSLKVIYIRFTGTYAAFRKESRAMFNELFAYARTHNLITEQETKVLTIYHDNPFITDEKNLRTSVAMTVPVDSKIYEEGRIGSMSFAGKYGVLSFDLKLNEYDKAWNYAYNEWLFDNQAVKARDAFPFELYMTEPPRNLKSTSRTDIYIPIE